MKRILERLMLLVRYQHFWVQLVPIVKYHCWFHNCWGICFLISSILPFLSNVKEIVSRKRRSDREIGKPCIFEPFFIVTIFVFVWKINQITYANLYPSTPMLSFSYFNTVASFGSSAGAARAHATIAVNTMIIFILDEVFFFVAFTKTKFTRHSHTTWSLRIRKLNDDKIIECSAIYIGVTFNKKMIEKYVWIWR